MSIVFLQPAYNLRVEFKDWITQEYIKWRGNAIGHERSISDFAEYIGISQPLMVKWMNGGKPSTDNQVLIAEKLGVEVYEVLEIPQAERPVPKNLRELINKIPPENQEELRDLIEAYILRQGWERIT